MRRMRLNETTAKYVVMQCQSEARRKPSLLVRLAEGHWFIGWGTINLPTLCRHGSGVSCPTPPIQASISMLWQAT
jgi:hypothetical protein